MMQTHVVPTVDYYVDNDLEQMTKAHPEDAGFDIRCSENYLLMPDSTTGISTGLHVHIPKGYVGIVKARSGLAFRTGYEVGAGVIDSGYTGEVKVLIQTNENDIVLKRGDKVAQMVIVPCSATVHKVASVEALGDHERGDSGFGSSGR